MLFLWRLVVLYSDLVYTNMSYTCSYGSLYIAICIRLNMSASAPVVSRPCSARQPYWRSVLQGYSSRLVLPLSPPCFVLRRLRSISPVRYTYYLSNPCFMHLLSVTLGTTCLMWSETTRLDQIRRPPASDSVYNVLVWTNIHLKSIYLRTLTYYLKGAAVSRLVLFVYLIKLQPYVIPSGVQCCSVYVLSSNKPFLKRQTFKTASQEKSTKYYWTHTALCCLGPVMMWRELGLCRAKAGSIMAISCVSPPCIWPHYLAFLVSCIS